MSGFIGPNGPDDSDTFIIGTGPPEISNISPTRGTPGTQVSILGKRFGFTQTSKSNVSFSGTAAAIVRWLDSGITVKVPAIDGGVRTVTVTNDRGSSTTSFTVLEEAPPAITRLSRPGALPGETLAIYGERFGVDNQTVTFTGQTVSILAWQPREISVRVPNMLGDKLIQVSTLWGKSNAFQFTILEPPVIDAVTPAQGPPDSAVTISGRRFGDFVSDEATKVVLRFVDQKSQVVVETPVEVASWTPTEIRAFVPGLPLLKTTGEKDVIVRTPLTESAPGKKFNVIDVGSITIWTRIEPHTRPEDPNLALEMGLRAEIADPLWLLGRQWTLGELHGEDAASPIIAHLQGESAPLWRWRPGAEGIATNLPPDVPLETLVERERIFPPRGGDRTPFPNRHLAAEAGLQFLRHVAAHLEAHSRAGTYREPYIKECPLDPPTDEERRTLDPESLRFLEVMAGRVPDGARLYASLRIALPAERGGSGTLPSEPTISTDDKEAVLAAIADWFTWCETLVSEPQADETAWERERIEYTFAVSAETAQGKVVLEAPEYFEGRLDWHAFVPGSSSLGGDDDDRPAPKSIDSSVVPTPVSYPGMPGPRWWEIEEGRVNFGSVEAGPTDLLRLLFVEFVSVFGNDWFVIPIGDVPTGSVSRVTSLEVTDTFGEQTKVKPFAPTGPRATWRMFQPASRDRTASAGLLLLPATVTASLESAPLEEVVFLRDEFANMAWAVERTVESEGGRPLSRHEAYEESRRRAEAEGELPTFGPTAIAYRLMTSVPDYWIPLIPDEHEGVRWLNRAAMRRPRPDGSLEEVSPRGGILQPGEKEFRIHDEEVPRDGVNVIRSWQLARDPSGGTHLWLGRRKRPGRGEGRSGLRFDIIEPLSPTER
jgi:hypothetical protein